MQSVVRPAIDRRSSSDPTESKSFCRRAGFMLGNLSFPLLRACRMKFQVEPDSVPCDASSWHKCSDLVAARRDLPVCPKFNVNICQFYKTARIKYNSGDSDFQNVQISEKDRCPVLTSCWGSIMFTLDRAEVARAANPNIWVSATGRSRLLPRYRDPDIIYYT